MDVIEVTSHADYLTVFTAIIYGFIASEFLSKWGVILRNRKSVVLYWQHTHLTIISFIYLMENWFSSFRKIEKVDDNIGYFYLSMLSPIIYYAATVFLFPKVDELHKIDYKIHFQKSARKVYGLYGILLASYIINSIVFYEKPILDIENIYTLIALIIVLLIAFLNRRKMYVFGICFLWVLLITWIAMLINKGALVK